MRTTLNKIREKSPCTSGWTKLLKNLGKTKPDDNELLITTILESNGLNDALWCLRAVTDKDREIRLFAVECARSVQHLMTDPHSIAAIDVAEDFANGRVGAVELRTARDAAGAVAWDAAWDAARDDQANLLVLVCEGCFDE